MMIGLEIHVQLKSEGKLFCRCPAKYRDAEPNTNVCPICISLPGAKPMPMNRVPLTNLIRLALALNCKINESAVIQRKHYFYPDLPSGYQRTSKPIAIGGKLGDIRIRELHIEEDPGRYELRKGLVDFNRSGVPLVEIVTEPDFKTPEEARMFLDELQAITQYLDATRDEPGSMRIDANISMGGGNRVEIKNINSYKGVYTALKYEIVRQKSHVMRGQTVIRETRHFDEAQGITVSLRKKETEEDYRYIPDPDLPPLKIESRLVKELVGTLPELPRAKASRFVAQYGIPQNIAWVLVSEREIADAFEILARKMDAKFCATWFVGPLKKQLNYRGITFRESRLKIESIEKLLRLFYDKKITDKSAQEILIKMLDSGAEPYELAQSMGRIDDEKLIESIVDEIVRENMKAVEDYRGGEEKALHFLAGKVMKKTRGRAAPEVVNRLLLKRLGGESENKGSAC
ncbi:MAG: Asp-tRNA(Asn)/Glu-tRNA(Gln) amidotransferase subunit GatB [Candidatus Micrarchaeia archaeon]